MTDHTFPPEAIPVARYIREHVPRPDGVPRQDEESSNRLRFHSMRFHSKSCPMGMLPDALIALPYTPDSFMDRWRFNAQQIVAFYCAWDAFTDPQAAVDAVWGTQT